MFLLPALALAALALLAWLPGAEAHHFRGGSLEVDAVSTTPTIGVPPGLMYQVELDGWLAFSITGLAGVPVDGQPVDIATNVLIDWGDGTQSAFVPVVDLIETTENLVRVHPLDVAGQLLRHTYLTADNNGQPWMVTWESGERQDYRTPVPSGSPMVPDLVAHINNPMTAPRLESQFGFTGGTAANNPPVSAIDPVVKCRHGLICNIPLLVSDADGDAVTVRFATDSEAMKTFGETFYQPGPCPAQGYLHALPPIQNPGVAHPGCGAAIAATLSGTTLTWDTLGAYRAGTPKTVYSAHVILSDGKTETPVEFQIELKPLCVCGIGTILAPVTQLVNQVLSNVPEDPAHILSWSPGSLPSGASWSASVPAAGVTATASISWTPPLTSLWGPPVQFHAKARYDAGYRVLDVSCITTVIPIALPPVALPLGLLMTNQGQALVNHVTAFDPQGLPLTYSIPQAPIGGTATVDSYGGLDYSPNPLFFGYDYFTVEVSNGWSQPASVWVSVLVIPDIPPVSLPDTYLVMRDEPTVIPYAAWVLANDVSPILAPMTWVVDSPPTLGHIEENRPEEGQGEGGPFGLPGKPFIPGMKYVPPEGGLKEDSTMMYHAVHYGRSGPTVTVTFHPLPVPTLPLGGGSGSGGFGGYISGEPDPSQPATETPAAVAVAASADSHVDTSVTSSDTPGPAGAGFADPEYVPDPCEIRVCMPARAHARVAAEESSDPPQFFGMSLSKALLFLGAGLVVGPIVVMGPPMLLRKL